MKRFILLLPLFALGQVSCISSSESGYRIVLENASEESLQNLSVQFSNQAVFHVSSLRPNTFQASNRLTVPHPKGVTIQWEREGGEIASAVVEAIPAPSAKFSGAVYYQILPKGQVKAFVEAAASGPRSDLPWNKPQNWEGVPGIPGLSMPE